MASSYQPDMKLLIVFLVFIVGLSHCDSTQERLPVWGVYCGAGHTNQHGIEPVDQMDRYCQYHDICVTAGGYLNCWCNEQLYYLVSNVEPQSEEESTAKDQILTFIYDAVLGCPNYWGFNSLFVATRVYSENVDNRGYNYITFYPSYSTQTYKARLTEYNDTGLLLRLNKKQYHEFTTGIYQNPVQNISRWIPYKITDLSLVDYSFQVYPSDYYVIYNPSLNESVLYHVKNETGCPSFTQYYQRSRSVLLRKISSHLDTGIVSISVAVIGCFIFLGAVVIVMILRHRQLEPQRVVVSV